MQIIKQKQLSRKESKSKYTKIEYEKQKFRGWYCKGIKILYSLIAIVRKGRGITESKEMEI